jgi:drug/metabolite transporter (DMT)-like permease
MLGQSVLTALFSMLIFGEKFTFRELLGGLMVIGGVYLVHFSKQERKE